MGLPEEDLANEKRLADIGELAGALTHEFNDVLNTILLHVALLQQNLPEEFRADLAEIRRQSKAVATLVKQFQRYRQHQRPRGEAVDLNELVSEAVLSLPAGARVDLQLDANPLRVTGSGSDLKRMVTFLLRNALGVTPTAGTVTVRTRQDADQITLSIEDSGPSIAPQALSHVFDPYTAVREGTNSLELAASKRLARRVQGDVSCQNRGEGGVAFIVKLPGATA
jgi:signal transduction histidine kinase